MKTKSKLYELIAAPALLTGILLLLPLMGMQFSVEVKWTLLDFIIAGMLLFGTGFTYKLITKSSSGILYRIAVGFALFSGLFLIWVNLAVRLIGSENSSANLMYYGVIAIGIIGAIIGRFKAKKMKQTLFAMAGTQALIAIVALFNGMHQIPKSSVTEVLGVNGLFITLFGIAALLFRYADQQQLGEFYRRVR